MTVNMLSTVNEVGTGSGDEGHVEVEMREGQVQLELTRQVEQPQLQQHQEQLQQGSQQQVEQQQQQVEQQQQQQQQQQQKQQAEQQLQPQKEQQQQQQQHSDQQSWTSDPWLEFTEQERDQIIRLPRRQVLVSNTPIKSRNLLLGLFDILYAYCYDYRTTMGEHNVESSWTIVKLSATLCHLLTDVSVGDSSSSSSSHPIHAALITSTRRSLCYPLYRHFELSTRVLDDVVVLFKLGRRALIKSVLAVRSLLKGATTGEFHILDRLYVEDYLLWLLDPR